MIVDLYTAATSLLDTLAQLDAAQARVAAARIRIYASLEGVFEVPQAAPCSTSPLEAPGRWPRPGRDEHACLTTQNSSTCAAHLAAGTATAQPDELEKLLADLRALNDFILQHVRSHEHLAQVLEIVAVGVEDARRAWLKKP